MRHRNETLNRIDSRHKIVSLTSIEVSKDILYMDGAVCGVSDLGSENESVGSNR